MSTVVTVAYGVSKRSGPIQFHADRIAVSFSDLRQKFLFDRHAVVAGRRGKEIDMQTGQRRADGNQPRLGDRQGVSVDRSQGPGGRLTRPQAAGNLQKRCCFAFRTARPSQESTPLVPCLRHVFIIAAHTNKLSPRGLRRLVEQKRKL